MTEQEAIELLQNLNVRLTDMSGHKTNGIEKIFGWNEITAICEAIKALEEVRQYRELERKLNGVYLTMLVNHFMEMAAEGEIQGYQRGRILTNEDANKWDAYLSIGTPEECRAAVEKQTAKKVIDNMPTDDDVWYQCPTCKGDLTNIRGFHCPYCGQKLDWGDE